jgi:hypothetical protein
MNNINKSLLDFIEIGVIASGGDPKNKGDHPSDKSSNQKVILPLTHDPNNVKQEHLAFSPMMHSPSSMSQYTFPGALDPGSLVYFLKFPGQNGGIILGQANDLVNYDKGGQGGKNLLQHEYFQKLFDRETGVLIPPEVKETEEDGVKVKAIKEKDKKHKHSLLKGLSSHNAQQSTTGFKLEEQKSVPTAKQYFDALPTKDMMGMLPGSVMSLAKMFQGLMGAGGGGGGGAGGGGASQNQNQNQTQPPIDRIKEKVKPELFDAMMSLSILVQGASETDTVTFHTTGRVHYDTYLTNAEDLLSQVSTIEDLFEVLHRLQYDEELFGLDQLEDTIMEIETAWGNANVIISITGVDLEYANTNVQNSYAQSMSSPSSSPSAAGGGGGGAGGGGGGAGGGNMFGKSAQTMMDMFKRLAPKNQKEAKKMHTKLNEEDTAKKLWKFAERTLKGGNPLSPDLFDK